MNAATAQMVTLTGQDSTDHNISEAIIQVDDYRPGSRNDGVEGEEGLVTFQTKTKFDEVIQQMIKRKFNPQKTSEKKSMKLKEDFIAANQEFDLWFGEVKSLLATDGTEVGGWFIKKKLLVEAYIIANEDKIKYKNEQADSLVDSGQFDSNDIRQRKEDINGRFQTIKRFCKDLYGLYRIIYDEIALINEKKRLLHMGFESELSSHEPAIKEGLEAGSELITSFNLCGIQIKQRLQQLTAVWQELKETAQFLAKIDEEEAWISEQQQLLTIPDLGDNMAAVQGLLKKHDAFETDISVHGDRCTDICEAGQKLIDERNHHADSIAQRCEQLRNKMYNLGELANVRKSNLLDNSAYLQFMWKADVVESWIADKEAHVKSDEFGRDLSSVQTLLTKQETFDIGLRAFEMEGIQNISALKDQLIGGKHIQAEAINKKFTIVITRWNKLLSDSQQREKRLLEVQDEFRQIEELYLTFAKKASAFNSWFENAEEDMTDPVRCNSIEEIRSLREAHAQFQASLASANADFDALAQLDKQIKSFGVGPNPYTWFTMEALTDTWKNLQMIIKQRDAELAQEEVRQEENDKLRKEFARHANAFYSWLTETRGMMMEGSGTLEEQLAAVGIKVRNYFFNGRKVRQKKYVYFSI